MKYLTKRICNNCGIEYNNQYRTGAGYLYTVETRYCSKTCARANVSGNSMGCIKVDPGKDTIEKEMLDFVAGKERYCTKEEICTGIKRSSKTLAKHSLSVPDINSRLGFTKPPSVFQGKVEEILKENFDSVEIEKKFEGLTGSTGYPLRVDFYIPEINTVVEADGSQHTDPNHVWANPKNGSVASYDEIKNTFFQDKGINLVRIPYKRNLKKEDVISKLDK